MKRTNLVFSLLLMAATSGFAGNANLDLNSAVAGSSFDQAVALYQRGAAPTLDSIDASKSLIGRSIQKSEPNTFLDTRFVAAETGDDVVGSIKYADVFRRFKSDGTEWTVADHVACLLKQGNTCTNESITPLAFDPTANALVYKNSIASGCSYKAYIRSATAGSEGKLYLVVLHTLDDTRPSCNPTAQGYYNGQTYGVSYFAVN